ncbi:MULTISPECIES: [FeFe] hydrogenase H-cluster radical SAM maturase HydG [Thermodesulfovibrio]|uniref:Thiamine biosynthesis enzyme n=1 Tax=Thermodesulfovibrio yellowstonii (strain ATCC 51303 / DSM 11347 / YP87) TaxID=289376 RepID=B5YH22_THEYD|nr:MULTISPECIES: [FeFe] hydrogenase H-cluster radical SAM maturase HydG [Thermodesulfovibrio]ACI22191.1 thiamine biosynthesis enzyme [Thermodesulfovibrio yellowstonii DSM 11347]MBC7189687.1 [FeFe] hydrogenase H-cluster radical SAM maturase HydG [Candidatus Aerophobetes bacterium]MDI6865008.1 [FeFe] hydrogenase H-cluster radical SAM maturase HydG [Thermodesulfovibrio yellowstonii]
MKAVLAKEEKNWINSVIKEEEIEKYMEGGRDFIDDEEIWEKLKQNQNPEPSRIRDILQKSLSIETLLSDETAALLNLKDPELWQEVFDVAAKVKKKVYDNRIVTFAPLYCGNLCVNNCVYCGFRRDNHVIKRRVLTLEEVKREAEVLAGEIGHKRLIVVYGEHPATGVHYIRDTIETIYSVKVKTKNGYGQIRRVNVNAAPMSIDELKMLKEVGIGTYQVFQETYHHDTYAKLHPKGTIKHHYQWRLYCHHRALEAGVDDVALGVLFGLYDWRFEVMGLVYHARELEKRFGIGPHTISFPRLEPAANTPFVQETRYKVSDEDFKKLIAVIRLSVPYTGMILTAREPAHIRREIIASGMITQTDASTKIGIGAYSDRYTEQELERQQFEIGDPRSLDEVIRELAEMGFITSFCTAGYRCGRTGDRIMSLLKTGKEAVFCKLNAVLTFREWLDDFASEQTKEAGEKVIQKELDELKAKVPHKVYNKLIEYYGRIKNGERDLYF